MFNRPVINKFEGNARCFHLLFNFAPPIFCHRFSVNGDGFLPAMWNFEAKIMSTTPLSVFDNIDHAIAAFDSNFFPPVEGVFLYYLVSDSVLSYLERIPILHIFELYPRGFSVLNRKHSSQPMVVLQSFPPEGVSMYASFVLITWPLVQWSTILSSIWYINLSSSHCDQRFSDMALATNSSMAPSCSSTLYSLVLISGFSL